MSGMKICENIGLILVPVIHVLCGTLGTSAAESSCPDVFRYEGSPGSEYGIITVPNPYPYLAINMSVAVYATAPMTLDSRTTLEPVDGDMWRKLAAGSRDPVFYRLVFPASSPMPAIKNITVNKNVICTGSRPNGAYFGIITVQHALYDKRCNSASLDCQFNIQQSADIRPQSSQKEDYSPEIDTFSFQHGLFCSECTSASPDCPCNFVRDGPPPPPVTPTPAPPPPPSTSTRCGLADVLSNPLMVKGRETIPAEWPWHAALFLRQGFDTKYRCGGSVIGIKTIITAAHCVTNSNGKAMAADSFLVALGRYDLTIRKEEGTQEFDVQRLLPHPAYNRRTFDADIALITLNTSIQYTRSVKPVCLWNPTDTRFENIIGKKGVVVGWGRDEYGFTGQVLRKVDMPVVSKETCKKQQEKFFLSFVHTNNFCAGYANGSSPCNGDGGGGMVIPSGKQDNRMIWSLRGIVSNTRPGEIAYICDPNSFVVFTDVAQYLDWIKPNLL